MSNIHCTGWINPYKYTKRVQLFKRTVILETYVEPLYKKVVTKVCSCQRTNMAPKITVGVRCDTIPNKVHTTVATEQTHHNISKALRFVGRSGMARVHKLEACTVVY